MEKGPKSILNIPGTRYSPHNAQLHVSTGIPSLDEILGGGLPVGTVALIEEDIHGCYSKVVEKYFIAEGVVSKHSVIVGSQDVDPHLIVFLVSELPAVISTDPEPVERPKSRNQDDLKIAFRYKNLSAKESSQQHQFGHYYDLSKKMSEEELKSADIGYWTCCNILSNGPNTFSNPAYHNLLQQIKSKMKEGKFFLKDKPEKRSVLRIVLHSLGSPLWLGDKYSFFSINRNRDLDMFVFCLRALVRSAFAVALISIPSHLYDENSLDRCIHASDIAVRLQAFHGTDLEKNSSLSDYHGFFHLTKLAAINTLASKHPGSVEYAFKLRKKKFCIEMLHLPPDVQDAKDGSEFLSCGGSKNLEF